MDIATRVEQRDEERGAGGAPEREPDAGEAQATPEPGDASAGDEPAGEEPAREGAEDAGRSAPSRGPGNDLTDDELAEEAFALFFASAESLSQGRLVELLERPEPARVRAALERLGERLEASGLPLRLQKLAGGWRLLTDPRAGDVIQRLRKEPRPERISSAALETLAIVAYRQPVTKAEIEAIRGVQSGALLRSLVDRGLVRVSGRADLPGAPLQYATTRDFLDRFGLGSLDDLPRDGELTSG